MRIATSRCLLGVALLIPACTASAPDALLGSGQHGGAGPTGTTSPPPGGDPPSATADGGDPAGTGTASGLPCDVDTVLAKSCRACHGATPTFGASAPLVTFADLQAPAPNGGSGKVYSLVQARIHDAAKPMPPTPYPHLADADAKVIDSWIAAGTPPSQTTCSGGDTPPPPATNPLACTPDQHIRPAAPYAMSATTVDQYVCYGFDVTTTAKRQVIALAPKIDNPKILHHLLLFQSTASVSSTPTPCQAFGSIGWTLISGWAPGGQNMVLPPEAGFPEEGTTHWVMQVHYNNAKGLTGEVDASGYDLCSTDQLRPNDADVMAPGSTSFTIPARSALNLTCTYTMSALVPKVHIFGATPHMHTKGKLLSTTVTSGGATKTVVDQQAFDFQTQLAFPADNDVLAGDTITTKCGWNNDTDQAINFGENTGDEMCFAFLGYYPKISVPLWSWVTPSASATCQ